jgi:hypothetical protein
MIHPLYVAESWVADVSARQVKKVSICGSFLAYCTQSEVFVAMYKISQEPAEDTLSTDARNRALYF